MPKSGKTGKRESKKTNREETKEIAIKTKSSKESNETKVTQAENVTKAENVIKVDNVTRLDKKTSVVKNNDEDEFRKRLEEKSKKYAHLPVYNKEEEMRKARRREAKVSKIFSSVDKQLGEFSDLTSAHMASHGITLVPSTTPFDDENTEEVEVSPEHTIKYNKGVLKPRQSEYQSQGTEHNSEECKSQETKAPDNKSQESVSQIPPPNVSVEIERDEPSQQSELSRLGAKPDLVSDVQSSMTEESAHDYESLGQTLTLLTQRMSDVTMEMKQEQDIPFIDNGDDGGDFRNVVRTHDSGGFQPNYDTSESSSEDLDTDSELAAILAPSLNPNLRVAKIQLESLNTGNSPTNPLVVKDRPCQGSDMLHTTTRTTVRREYTDI